MTTVALILAGVIILIAGVIRAAGASLVRTARIDAVRDAAEGDARAAVVAELLEDRPRLQPALGIFNALLLVIASILSAWALTRMLNGSQLATALVLLGFVMVLFGDLIPRSVGRSRPRRLAYAWAWLLRPALAIGDATADLVDLEEESESDDRDDDDENERELISSVIDLGDTIVREVMVPRPDMVTVLASDSTESAIDLIIEAGRSRVPVVGDNIDDIVGVLYAKDLLKMLDDAEEHRSTRLLARPPYFVPETKSVLELLREMQANQGHIAIVVDEFGGTAGLVTIEDLLEEIVGEIADEYDEEEPMVQALDDGQYLLDARMAIDELASLLGVELPDEEWDTVGGFVLGVAGRVPAEGESFDSHGHRFVADRVQGRRISRIRLEVL